MSIDHSTLTKGQIRKLNALRKSVGDDIAENAFGKWMTAQSKTPKEVRDPVADALVAALDQFKDDKTFRLGSKGYVVRRAKGIRATMKDTGLTFDVVWEMVGFKDEMDWMGAGE